DDAAEGPVTAPYRVPGSMALLTRTVRAPHCSPVPDTSRSAAASSARSAAMNSASPLMLSMTRVPRSASRPVTTTDAPSAANRRAIWAPIPDVAPVTSATSPVRRPATSGAEDVGQLGRHDDLELVVGARRRVPVGTPA